MCSTKEENIMFVAEGVSAAAEIREQHEIDSIVSTLASKGYLTLLRTMLSSACTVAGIPISDVQVDLVTERRVPYRTTEAHTRLTGDILFKDDVAYIVQPIRHSLHIWQIRHHSLPSSLTSICSDVESAIKTSIDGRRVRGMNFDWKPIKRKSIRALPVRRYYQNARLNTKPVDYTQEELDAAKLLLFPDVRTFILRLAQAGKARAIDAVADTEKLPMDELINSGLIKKEYLVLCRKDSHTICAIQDPSELDSQPGGKFSCTVCGRAFKDELIQEIYALSDTGKGLLSGSRWMTIWVTDLLMAAGVSRDGIAWNPTVSEDELDIMIDELGPRVFFELKDREFGLGDAYPFAYRVSRYGGAFGIVITTDKVADEAKKFFKEQRPNMGAKILEIEGQAEIEKRIIPLVDEFSRRGVMLLLSELAEPLALDPRPIVNAWMDRIAKELSKP